MEGKRIQVLNNDKLGIADAVPLADRPKDIRAQHCETARDLDLFKFSSDYQSYKGGFKDLHMETGLNVPMGDSVDILMG